MVLDTTTPGLYFATGYYGTPVLPFGPGFNTTTGEALAFTNVLGKNEWDSTITGKLGHVTESTPIGG